MINACVECGIQSLVYTSSMEVIGPNVDGDAFVRWAWSSLFSHECPIMESKGLFSVDMIGRGWNYIIFSKLVAYNQGLSDSLTTSLFLCEVCYLTGWYVRNVLRNASISRDAGAAVLLLKEQLRGENSELRYRDSPRHKQCPLNPMAVVIFMHNGLCTFIVDRINCY